MAVNELEWLTNKSSELKKILGLIVQKSGIKK